MLDPLKENILTANRNTENANREIENIKMTEWKIQN